MQRPIPYKWELIVLLWLAFFLNQADRQIYNNLIPLIQPDLNLSDVQIGLVASVFTCIYGILVPLSGYVGDVLRRKWIVITSLLVWSTATLLTGFCTGLITLIIFRGIATGGGEAFYYPSANSLIGQFHHKTRALAMAIHQTALYVGIVASFVAGFVGERYGWRSAFLLFGGFGIVMAFIMIFRVENTPPETSADNGDAPEEGLPLSYVLRQILCKPTVLFLSVAFAGMVFVNIGYLTWMPTLLHEKFGLSVTEAGFSALFYHHAFAFIGVLAGGRLSDYWAKWRRTIRIEFEYLGLLLGAPFIYLIGTTDNLWVCYAALAAFGLFRGVYDSNLFAALFDVIQPRLRSSAVGVMLCFAFITGAFAPIVLGAAKAPLGLDNAMASLGGVYLFSGLCILVACYTTFARDYYYESPEEPMG